MNNPILIISGKTASGKDTVMLHLLAKYPDFKRVITSTSRSPRTGEQAGIDYNFISEKDFKQKAERGDFIEFVEYGGNLYGTEKAQILNNLNQGLIWRIDPSRAAQIRDLIKNSFEKDLVNNLLKRVLVIYLSVNNEVILSRLRERGLSEDKINKRMQEDKAFWEKYQQSYDYVVENVPGKLNETVDKIIDIIENHSS